MSLTLAAPLSGTDFSPRRALLLAAPLTVALVVVSMPSPLGLTATPPAAMPVAAGAQVVEGYGQLPISFEPNVGQAPGRYDFVARGQGFGMAIDATGTSLALGAPEGQDLLRLDLVGADPAAVPSTLEPLAGTVNFVLGGDRARWRSGVPTFGRVSYRDVLPGIAVTYYGTNEGTLEYDFVVAPAADPDDIRLGFTGAESVALDGGSLVVSTAGGVLTQEAPVLYQEVGGSRVPVEGGFLVDGDQVSFAVGEYDERLPLVIDPVLVYSSYLGGAGDDVAWEVAVDGSGEAYVAGSTTSVNFPTQGAFQGTNAGGGGGGDAFVTRMDAAGTPVYSTYLGGSAEDVAYALALDASGAAYVTGFTFSTDFPTQAPYQANNAGGNDAFVTKLNAAGTPVYSTYLGGQIDDLAKDIAVDGAGAAYLTGVTRSTDFPNMALIQLAHGGGSDDAFVTKLNPAGTALDYSGFLGGSSDDYAWGIAVDGAGAAYVAGDTFSPDFPVIGAFQAANAGGSDAFVTKLNPAGTAMDYSTYLGGSGADSSEGGIAVDGTGSAYVAGYTQSATFPTQGAFQGNSPGNDGFVTKLDVTGSALAYSTYLGGSGGDAVDALAVDASGAAHVAGSTSSTDFPLLGAFQSTNAGADDGFVTKLDASGSALGYSSYLGGSSFDYVHGVAVDGSGAAYVAGATSSTNLPVQAAYQPASGGGASDGFVAKLSGSSPPPPSGTCGGQPVTIQVAAPNLSTYGTSGADVIRGTAGSDKIYGLGGNDIICGRGGVDALFGGAGGDNIYGGTGHDRIRGNGGSDNLFGNAGRDRIIGHAGQDALFGGIGRDRLYGRVGNDFARGGPGPDVLKGGTGADILRGEAGRDLLRGGFGQDVLKGGAGSDILYGDAGKDKLFGGQHVDACHGGPPPTGDSAAGCENVFSVP